MIIDSVSRPDTSPLRLLKPRVRNISFRRRKAEMFPIIGYYQLGMVEVRAITYIAPLPRPRYFISATGTVPYLPYRWLIPSGSTLVGKANHL